MHNKLLNLILVCTLTLSVNLQAMHQASSSPVDMSVGKIAELITGLLRAPAASMATKNEFSNPAHAKKYQILANALRVSNAILSCVNGFPQRTFVVNDHGDFAKLITSTWGLGIGNGIFLISDCIELIENCFSKSPDALTGNALKQKQRYEIVLYTLHALEGLLAGGCALTNGITITNIESEKNSTLTKSLYPHGLIATLLTTVRLVETIIKRYRDNDDYLLLGGLTALYVIKVLGFDLPQTCQLLTPAQKK